jgi:hypothetical protein
MATEQDAGTLNHNPESVGQCNLKGVVYDDKGRALQGVKVEYYEQAGSPLGTKTTGSDGKYEFSNVTHPASGTVTYKIECTNKTPYVTNPQSQVVQHVPDDTTENHNNDFRKKPPASFPVWLMILLSFLAGIAVGYASALTIIAP